MRPDCVDFFWLFSICVSCSSVLIFVFIHRSAVLNRVSAGGSGDV